MQTTMGVALLKYYQAIEDASSEMLAAARRDEWDEVLRLESACAVLIAQLRHAARDAELPSEDQRRKTEIMQRILRNDAQIRFLAEPWLHDIEQLICGGASQQTH